jgi:transcriptional regulator with XRE-family HTH domain
VDNIKAQLAQVYRALMTTNDQINQLQNQLRRIREGKKLTLAKAAELSKGAVTAIALGSYERGDRSIAIGKLLTIADMYGVPISELFTPSDKEVINSTTTFDIRKLKCSNTELSNQVFSVIQRITQLRSDWNGEVISLRATDLTNLFVFSGISGEQLDSIRSEFAITRSK